MEIPSFSFDDNHFWVTQKSNYYFPANKTRFVVLKMDQLTKCKCVLSFVLALLFRQRNSNSLCWQQPAPPPPPTSFNKQQ